MNAVHFHLVLNHVPVVGMIFVLPLLAWTIYRRNKELLRVTLAAFVVIAVATTVVYLTGEPTEEVVAHVAETNLDAQETAALASFVLAGALGLLGLAGLWRLRGLAKTPRWLVASAAAGALIVTIALGWTANLGGLIRHPEAAVDFVVPQSGSAASVR